MVFKQLLATFWCLNFGVGIRLQNGYFKHLFWCLKQQNLFMKFKNCILVFRTSFFFQFIPKKLFILTFSIKFDPFQNIFDQFRIFSFYQDTIKLILLQWLIWISRIWIKNLIKIRYDYGIWLRSDYMALILVWST